MASFEAACYAHIAKVERFLAVRRAAGPPEIEDLYAFLQQHGTPQGELKREEIEKWERETVSAFLDSEHLDRGISLIDFLIESGFVNPATRKHVAEPKSISQIEDASPASAGAPNTCRSIARRPWQERRLVPKCGTHAKLNAGSGRRIDAAFGTRLGLVPNVPGGTRTRAVRLKSRHRTVDSLARGEFAPTCKMSLVSAAALTEPRHPNRQDGSFLTRSWRGLTGLKFRLTSDLDFVELTLA
jgi:hypothetical protein